MVSGGSLPLFSTDDTDGTDLYDFRRGVGIDLNRVDMRLQGFDPLIARIIPLAEPDSQTELDEIEIRDMIYLRALTVARFCV